jgi:hypothetical protein
VSLGADCKAVYHGIGIVDITVEKCVSRQTRLPLYCARIVPDCLTGDVIVNSNLNLIELADHACQKSTWLLLVAPDATSYTSQHIQQIYTFVLSDHLESRQCSCMRQTHCLLLYIAQ